MKRNGFTLIELLAVIVILAIIALIATPIILGIINDAKEESNERSVELYASAVRNGIAAYQLREGKEIEAGSYTSETLPFTVEYDGEVECATIELYEDGGVYVEGCTVNGGEKTYNHGEQRLSEFAKLCTANTTKAKALVWRGDDDPALETSYDEEEVGLLASVDGAYTPGVAYTCDFGETEDTKNLTFFVLSSTENDVTLIAGFNLGDNVAWNVNGVENAQPETANVALASRTSNWGKLTDEQIATIKLPTVYQIAEAGGITFDDSAIDGLPKWLYSYTALPVAYGYWTSSSANSDLAWDVEYNGYISNNFGNNDSLNGVRPVITLSI